MHGIARDKHSDSNYSILYVPYIFLRMTLDPMSKCLYWGFSKTSLFLNFYMLVVVVVHNCNFIALIDSEVRFYLPD